MPLIAYCEPDKVPRTFLEAAPNATVLAAFNDTTSDHAPPIFGRAAEALLHAQPNVEPHSILFYIHSHRQLDEYDVAAGMMHLSSSHWLVRHSSLLAVCNNIRLPTCATDHDHEPILIALTTIVVATDLTLCCCSTCPPALPFDSTLHALRWQA